MATATGRDEPKGEDGDGKRSKGNALHNAQQFYRWFSELEAERTNETEGKYKEYASTLHGYRKSCDDILDHEKSAKLRLEELEKQHKYVTETIRRIHNACENLVKDRSRLAEFAQAIRNKLEYFDDLEQVANKLQSINVDVESDSFLSMVRKLDECITFIGDHPQYADSAAYVAKFRHLQFRALSSVRSYVTNGLKRAKQQVLEGLTKNGNLVAADGSETSLLYVRFKASAPELKSTMEEIEDRINLPEYSKLVTDCLSYYFDTRLTLIRPTVEERIRGFSEAKYLPGLLRSGFAYLVQVCQLEFQLFQHFFPRSADDPSNLLPLIEPVFTIMYDIARPLLIHVNDVDTLCELVEIVKGEVLDDQISRKGKPVSCLRPLVEATLSDVQERLTYRAQTYIKEEIGGFVPSLGELDYPELLYRNDQEAAGSKEQQEENGVEIVEAPESPEEIEEDSREDNIYPAVLLTVEFIPKIYYSLGSEIFAGLAQEAVEACTLSIGVASKKISKTASILDGLLFQIRHLLILREQLAPFEASFSFVDKELDFSHMRDHLVKILNGEASMLTLSASNALFQLMSKGAPTVRERQKDSKRELEEQLKSVCEAYIMTITKQMVEPMLSFVTKVSAVRSAGSSQEKPLREQAFASVEKLRTAVARSSEALTSELEDIVKLTRVYLPNASTRAVLFQPVRSNIAEAHSQIAQLLESDYNEADAKQVSLLSSEQLDQLMDLLG